MTDILDRFFRDVRERAALKGIRKKEVQYFGYYQNCQFSYYIYSTIAKITAQHDIILSQPSNTNFIMDRCNAVSYLF
jgi:hypothetical protein